MSVEALPRSHYTPISSNERVNEPLCSYLLKIIKIVVGIVVFPLGLYWCFCKEDSIKRVTLHKPISSPDLSINQFQEDFKNFFTYVKTECVCPRLFISDLAARFQVKKYEACGQNKIVFRSLDQEIVKVQFVNQFTSFKELLKEVAFSISHPTLVNQPKNITLYLKKGGLTELQSEDQEFIAKHSIPIIEIDESTFEGALIWKEEAFLQSAEQIIENIRKEGTANNHLDSLNRIIRFWEAIRLEIVQNKQYLVSDLGPANIAIFKDRTIRIIDVQPWKTPYTISQVDSNIKRYQSALQTKPISSWADL